MEELFLAAAVLAAVLYFGSSSTPSVLVSTPANLPPSSPLISFDEGGPRAATSCCPRRRVYRRGLLAQARLSQLALSRHVHRAAAGAAASPYVSGGIAGTAASGGNPFGSALRPGVSAGTGTTSVNSFSFLRPVAF